MKEGGRWRKDLWERKGYLESKRRGNQNDRQSSEACELQGFSNGAMWTGTIETQAIIMTTKLFTYFNITI